MAVPGTSISVIAVDLSGRFRYTTTVVGSPALAAETIIGTLTMADIGSYTVASAVWLSAWASYTVGTSGVSVTLRVRQSAVGGTLVASSGALTKVAANLYADDVQAIDTSPPAGGVYEFTMQVGSGGAVSTVSAVVFTATII